MPFCHFLLSFRKFSPFPVFSRYNSPRGSCFYNFRTIPFPCLPSKEWERGRSGFFVWFVVKEFYMSEAFLDASVQRIETTIGDLCEMLTTIAFEVGSSESESYELASVALSDILHKSGKNISFVE